MRMNKVIVILDNGMSWDGRSVESCHSRIQRATEAREPMSHDGDCEYGLVAVKRRWVPEWLFIMFAPVIIWQPFRWIFTTAVADLGPCRECGNVLGRTRSGKVVCVVCDVA